MKQRTNAQAFKPFWPANRVSKTRFVFLKTKTSFRENLQQRRRWKDLLVKSCFEMVLKMFMIDLNWTRKWHGQPNGYLLETFIFFDNITAELNIWIYHFKRIPAHPKRVRILGWNLSNVGSSVPFPTETLRWTPSLAMVVSLTASVVRIFCCMSEDPTRWASGKTLCPLVLRPPSHYSHLSNGQFRDVLVRAQSLSFFRSWLLLTGTMWYICKNSILLPEHGPLVQI